MPKTTFIAIDPAGVAHTRTSDNRIYTHAAFAMRKADTKITPDLNVGWRIENVGRNWDQQKKYAVKASFPRWEESARKFMKKYPDRDAYVAKQAVRIRKNAQALYDLLSKPHWECLGYSSRLDLAHKVADTNGKWQQYTGETAVVEVTKA